MDEHKLGVRGRDVLRDAASVLTFDYLTPFANLDDLWSRLLPFHIMDSPPDPSVSLYCLH